MDDHEITITIPLKQATQAHIEHLQATLTKRNEQIERLAARLEEAENSEPNQSAMAAAYKRGWQAAAQQLMSTVHRAAQELASVRKDAWGIYLQSEKRDF